MAGAPVAGPWLPEGQDGHVRVHMGAGEAAVPDDALHPDHHVVGLGAGLDVVVAQAHADVLQVGLPGEGGAHWRREL